MELWVSARTDSFEWIIVLREYHLGARSYCYWLIIISRSFQWTKLCFALKTKIHYEFITVLPIQIQGKSIFILFYLISCVSFFSYRELWFSKSLRMIELEYHVLIDLFICSIPHRPQTCLRITILAWPSKIWLVATVNTFLNMP